MTSVELICVIFVKYLKYYVTKNVRNKQYFVFPTRKVKETMYIGEKPYFCSACGQKFVPTISSLRPLPARQFSHFSYKQLDNCK